VQEWIARFGDPRDPKVDPIDGVERIPFMETRNHVQRAMANMQVFESFTRMNQSRIDPLDLAVFDPRPDSELRPTSSNFAPRSS
jgi:hypothetical protein